MSYPLPRYTVGTSYTVGSVTCTPYDKYPFTVQVAPTAIDLARLYDKAAKQIEKLVYALELCAPLTARARQARSEAFDAVMGDMKS